MTTSNQSQSAPSGKDTPETGEDLSDPQYSLRARRRSHAENNPLAAEGLHNRIVETKILPAGSTVHVVADRSDTFPFSVRDGILVKPKIDGAGTVPSVLQSRAVVYRFSREGVWRLSKPKKACMDGRVQRPGDKRWVRFSQAPVVLPRDAALILL